MFWSMAKKSIILYTGKKEAFIINMSDLLFDTAAFFFQLCHLLPTFPQL